jgi:hypothetical protein
VSKNRFGLIIFDCDGVLRLVEAGAHHTFERMRELPGLIDGAA